MSTTLFTAAWLAASILMVSDRAHAALGDRVTVTQSSPSTTDARAYNVRETVVEMVTYREYYSSDGVVFAVSWLGMHHPDMPALLGRFHADYESANSATPRALGTRRRNVRGSDVTVERWGRPRALAGRAYVTSLLPNGVSLDEIR